MNSRTGTATRLSRFLVLAMFLTLAPAALAKTTWYVDGVNGSDSNDCLSSQTACQTIAHAISLCSSGDTIIAAPAIYTENLTIDRSLKLIGSDAATTIVDGNQAGSVLTISDAKAHVTLSKLTIQNGYASFGGGINNSGTLTIRRSTVSRNLGNVGGGIYNVGALTIDNSTLSGNTVVGDEGGSGQGGGIYNVGTLTIDNSTLNENRTDGYDTAGGGVAHWGASLTINNSTLSGNSGAYGGGIYTQRGTIFQNSIVANSTEGGNCYVINVFSKGYNLSSDGSCPFNSTGDMNNTDPKLGKFGNHGGPTQTIKPLKGSPAIDAGNPNGCTDDKGNLLKKDQRGWPRPGKNDQDKRCDIGALEVQHD